MDNAQLNTLLDKPFFKIDKNIPLPSHTKRGTSKKMRDTLATMEIGDSFTCDFNEYRIFGNIKHLTDFSPKSFAARREGDNYRIFRVS